MLSIKNSTILHILSSVYRLSPPRLIVPSPLAVLTWVYLLLPSLLLNELCASVVIRDFSILCGIDVINQKPYHPVYLIHSIQIISTRINGNYTIPPPTCNFDMDIPVTSISPLQEVVYKCSHSTLQHIVWD